MRKLKKNGGFTLVEMLVVMSLIIAAISLGLFFDFSSFYGYYFHGDRDALITALQHARSEAIANVCRGTSCLDGRPHGVAIRPSDNPNSYVIFQSGAGSSDYANRDDEFDVILDSDPTITISGSITEVVFTQLSGNVDTPGNFVLTDATGRTSTIDINSEGQISWTN
jgi:prepilin-type N-terminal cleavage/methylation domain-containing protein